MRIVHIIAYYTPYWKYQENYLVLEQVKMGHDVHVITSNLNFPHPDYKATSQKAIGQRRKILGKEILDGYTVHQLPVSFELSARVLLKGSMSRIKSIAPDLIICHGITQFFTAQLLYNKSIKTRIIADEHILFSDVEKSRTKLFLLRIYGKLFRERIMMRFSKLVAISDGVGLLFQRVLGFPPEKISVIPLGTDIHEFQPDKLSGMAFRNQYEIKEDDIVVGYTGKISEYKKVHFLLDAANELDVKNLHILLVGDISGDYFSFLQEKIKQSKIPVTLLSAQPAEKLPSIYNACDILAWPAHQTISTVNASACGKPIICSNFLKERYASGQGIGVEAGNYTNFKAALDRLLNSPELREEMGRKGRCWAVNEVSWEEINRRFID